jgi:hypothetical protein
MHFRDGIAIIYYVYLFGPGDMRAPRRYPGPNFSIKAEFIVTLTSSECSTTLGFISFLCGIVRWRLIYNAGKTKGYG